MVGKEEFRGEESFRCEECGFHYRNRENAEKCENHCAKYDSCNSEVAKKAMEMD